MNSDLFRPPILAFKTKLDIFGPPKNLLKHDFRGILGRLKMAIFDLQTSVWGLNRSEFNQESSLGDQIGLRSL